MTTLEIVDVEKTAKRMRLERRGVIVSCEFCERNVSGGDEYQAHLFNHLIHSICEAFAEEQDTCTCQEGDITCPFCSEARAGYPDEPDEDLPTDQELDRAREELAECDIEENEPMEED